MKKHKKKKGLKLALNIEGEPVEIAEMSFKEWLKTKETSSYRKHQQI